MTGRARPRTLILLVVVSLVLLGEPARAAAPPLTATGDDVAGLLARATSAQRDLSWSGTQLVSTWSSGQSASTIVDLVHEPGTGVTTRAHDATSGTTGAAHDTDVTVPDGAATSEWLRAESTPGPLSLLLGRYAVAIGPVGQVAGRAARTLVLRRGGVTVARLWLDDVTGLLLRREVYDLAGRTTSAMVFLDVTVLDAAPDSEPGPSANPGAAQKNEPGTGPGATTGAVSTTELRRAGWLCPDRIGSDLVLHDARALEGSIMALRYSDGLSSLSVFEQHGRLDPAAVAHYPMTDVGGHRVRVQRGLPARAVWQSGATVVTVVSDEPDWQLVDVVAAMPPTAPPTMQRRGWLARAAHDIVRAARWLTPLR